MKKIFNPLRQLAKSSYWQIIYSRSKEVEGINLFDNNRDFTALQIVFLQWLEIYHSLELDLAMKESYISREVINDDIRCDAYLLIRESIKNKSEKDVAKDNIDSTRHSVIFSK